MSRAHDGADGAVARRLWRQGHDMAEIAARAAQPVELTLADEPQRETNTGSGQGNAGRPL